jgi:hypothetical protein
MFGIKPDLKSADYQPFNQRRYQMNSGKDSFLFSDMIRYILIMNLAAFTKNVVADPAVSPYGAARVALVFTDCSKNIGGAIRPHLQSGAAKFFSLFSTVATRIVFPLAPVLRLPGC